MPDQPSEFDLIAQLAPFLAGTHGDVAVGHGDDAAVLDLDGRLVVVAVDVVVEGVHFTRGVSTAGDVGWKAVAVNVSDLAAMGARPDAAVVGLCRPGDVDVAEVERLYAGMSEACTRWGLRLVGGDTVRADALALSVTVFGRLAAKRPVTRSGARPGDALVVVGSLGGPAAAVAGLAAGVTVDPRHLAAHRRPRALVEAGCVLAQGGASAMIDVSDGLGADLGHICAASGVRARVRADALPLDEGLRDAAAALGADPLDLACGGGEDFALLATVPEQDAPRLAAAAGAAEGVAAAVIGEVVAAVADEPVAELLHADGTTADLSALGYDHYAAG